MLVKLEVPNYTPDLGVWAWLVKCRDNFICSSCKQQFNSSTLQAHHLNKHPEDKFLLSNGITLCKACHRNSHRVRPRFTKKPNEHISFSSDLTEDNLLSIRQITEIFGVHHNTVYKYIRSGQLKAFKLGGSNSVKHWHIRAKDLETFLQGAGSEHAEANNKKPIQEQVAGSAPTL